MKQEIFVIALGGNAIGGKKGDATISQQFHLTERAMEWLVPLLKKKSKIVFTFGNGPQVGNILIRMEAAIGKTYPLPLEVCVAESEGEIGYMIEQVLHNVLSRHRLKRPVVSVLTQVLVDEDDPHFKNPTKPIGPVLDAAHATLLEKQGHAVAKTERGYRRVVPSPRPQSIDDVGVIRHLLKTNAFVIAAGGGGIPVVKKNGQLHGVEAVIDKDLASAVLANDIHADMLLILTDVPCAYLNYRRTGQKALRRITAEEAKHHLLADQFEEGSMKPKIEAALKFLTKKGRKVIITSPDQVMRALQGKSGTKIVV